LRDYLVAIVVPDVELIKIKATDLGLSADNISNALKCDEVK